jgi:hypothetical protein
MHIQQVSFDVLPTAEHGAADYALVPTWFAVTQLMFVTIHL